jgi:predicted nucleic acid-binding protein
MTDLFFVDTNVLLYAQDSSEPLKQRIARERIADLWVSGCGRVSVQVLSEFYATITRKARFGVGREEAWREIEELMTWQPQPVDTDLITRGHAIELRYKLSWWDSLVVAAAEAQGCSILLTEDLQDGARYGSVHVENPFKHGVSEPRPEYVVAAKPASRHPPRGRPKGAKTKRPTKRTAAG